MREGRREGGCHWRVREEGEETYIKTFLHLYIPDKPGVHRCSEELFPRRPTEERLATHNRTEETIPDSLTKLTLKIPVLY